jgi:hypothetical protein
MRVEARGARRLETRCVYVCAESMYVLSLCMYWWVHLGAFAAGASRPGWVEWSSSRPRTARARAKTKGAASAGRLLGTICLIGRLAGADQHFGQARPLMRQGAGIPAANHGRQTSPDIPKLSPACHASERGLILPRRRCSRRHSHGETMQHRAGALLSPLQCAAQR